MKKKLLKYFLLLVVIFASIIIYLSLFGVETDRFNEKIKDELTKVDDRINLKLKKIKLTLDPLNLKIKAKTIGAEITYQNNNLELEYIKTEISLNSLIKNKIVSSKLKISTKSILLSDLVAFTRMINNKTELVFLEHLIKKGYVIADIEVNFDDNGKIKKDYKINGLLKDGKINLLKNHSLEKVNFLFNVENEIINFQKINFLLNDINFFSNKIKITQNNNNYLFEGLIKNKISSLSIEILKLINSKFKKIYFSSTNNFSFNLNNKFKLSNLVIDSEIKINEAQYDKSDILQNILPEINNIINLKSHKIKARYKKDNLFISGSGRIQLDKKFDKIDYLITNRGLGLNVVSNIALSELNLKNQKFIKNFFPKTNKILNLKDHQIKVNYKENKISLTGLGKIKLEKEFDTIDYSISKINNKYNFDTKLRFNETSLKINTLNYNKKEKSKTLLTLIGDYEVDNDLIFKEASIRAEDNLIMIKNLSLDKKNRIIKVDQINLDYFDIKNKKNELYLKRTKENNYELSGLMLNASSLISDLLERKDDVKSKIFQNDINLNINLNKTYIDENNIVNNLKGKLYIKDNEVSKAKITAFFENKKKIDLTINTKNNEKVTTLYSFKAKPFVNKYKFIKGFREGDLNFYSSKKDGISNSVLKIDNFKIQEIPVLAKLLTLASLQGIADLLTGEGIRFTDFEMNFSNNKKLMIIDEMYAIGPSISILMEGYIQSNELISLRGTLVPASTINRSIASIPLIGDLLIGKKVGEGIFGVSFKIKGPPKNLDTTVNPIKTLTPRFITRTLEKIKKN
jgi:hypothetical protein